MVALTSLAPCRSASGRHGQIKAPRAKFHAPSRLQCYELAIAENHGGAKCTMNEGAHHKSGNASLYSTEEHFRASRA
eukprot:2718203-Pleurochrysis_carterae.AAC.1